MKSFPATIFFVLLYLAGPAQTTIRVVFKNPHAAKISQVDIFDLSQKEFHTAAYQDTVTLHFTKTNIDCYNIRYHENGKKYYSQVWLEPGNVTILAHIDSARLVIDSVINAPFYYKVREFNREYQALFSRKDTAAVNQFLLDAYQENMANPFSIHAAYYYVMLNQNSRPALMKLKTLSAKQGDNFSWFLIYPSVFERLEKILSVSQLNLAEYTLINTKNKKTTLLPGAATYYVLDFWFLACPPCLQQHVEIKKNMQLLQQKGIEVISISTDTDFKKWEKYLDKHDYEWANYLQYKSPTLTGLLGISAFPTYIIMDNKGNIIDSYNSFAGVLSQLKIESSPR